jgi:N-formylmaleamate deformylase
MWHSDDISVNGLRLRCTRAGNGKPPLVLAHGITDQAACWTPIAQALSADYDVVMYDARGHGDSQLPNERFGLPELAADLAGLIAALDLGQPPVIGHSMGAITALAMAGLYPGVARAIVLEDPPQWWAPALYAPPPTSLRRDLRDWYAGIQGKTFEQMLAEKRLESPLWPAQEAALWVEAKLRFNPAVLDALDDNPAARIDWPAALGRVACPALLLTGDPACGAIVTPEGAAELQRLAPGLRVAHFPGAGHSIRRDFAEGFVQTVLAFFGAVS